MTLHRSVLPTLALTTALALSACAPPAEDSSSDEPSSSAPTSSSQPPSPSAEPGSPSTTATPTPPPEETGPVLEVTINGDEVSPNAEDISLKVGEPLLIRFKTDRGGELHVHSKPEQYVSFEAGSSEKELVITTPGSVEVEEHDTEAVVALIEVG